jgi:hypothetical protein
MLVAVRGARQMKLTIHRVPSHPSKPWAVGLELNAGVFQVTCYCETRELAERVVECLNREDLKNTSS